MKAFLFIATLFALGASHAQPLYIQLDGKWYAHNAEMVRYFANIDPALRKVTISGAIMQNCRQPDGQPPIPVGMAVHLGPSDNNIIFVSKEPVDYFTGAVSGGVRYIKMQSPLGNLICDNEIPVPSGGPGDPMFKNGFE